MRVNYETNSHLRALLSVFDEYAEWYAAVLRRAFYSEQHEVSDAEPLRSPTSFESWLEQAQSGGVFSDIALGDLRDRHESLIKLSSQLSGEQSGQKPAAVTFDAFVALYNGFMDALRRLQYDCLLADSGIDSLSGLRSDHAMIGDMERELERLARRGNPFCLALAQVDNYDELKAGTSKEQHKEIIAKLSDMIKQCLRSFDDAYRSGEGEFIMSLKQTEKIGGTAALDRLRGLLAADPIVVPREDGSSYTLTMSYCVAEPQPGDTLEDLLKDMRADLGNYRGEGNTALEHQELSQLQRFLKGSDGD